MRAQFVTMVLDTWLTSTAGTLLVVLVVLFPTVPRGIVLQPCGGLGLEERGRSTPMSRAGKGGAGRMGVHRGAQTSTGTGVGRARETPGVAGTHGEPPGP